jgi:hypothetical protein
MKKEFTFKQDIENNCCSNCGKKLNPEKTIWLEYSITDGCVYDPNEFPQDHDSQGCFLYKNTTKAQLFEIAYQYAMLMKDEDEQKAFEFLKEEKNRI